MSYQHTCLAIIPRNIDRCLQDFKLENYPQPILLWWPPFYFNNEMPQSMLGTTKTMHHAASQFTLGGMPLQHIPGKKPAAFSCVCKYCDFVNTTCPVYTSLLNVPATRPCYMSPLHVLATCRLSVYYTRFCRCHMSLQHDPLCLATFIVWNRVPYQVLFAVFAICWSKYLLKYHLFWRYHLFFLSAQL